MGRAGALALAFRREQRPDRVGVALRARTATAAAGFAVGSLPRPAGAGGSDAALSPLRCASFPAGPPNNPPLQVGIVWQFIANGAPVYATDCVQVSVD